MRDMDICVTPPPGEQTQLSCAQEDYARYLSHDIGLSARTVEHYTGIIAPFLREHIRAKGPPHWSSLKAEQVFKFFRRSAQRHSSHHLQLLRTALRSFLRYLQHRGEVQHDLTNCLPRVTRRRMAGLPKYLSAEQVRRIIGSCHRATAVGKRDYAILLILARLGLRAAEVCTLKLDDIDWQDGQMMLRGKGGEKAVMPLPRDVGKAVLEYLKHGRPRSVSRRVFLRHNAPHVGLASPGCISSIVSSAIKRADIDCPSKGAHVLRHTLATQMIRRGASLREVGHVLRHRDPNTTRIYAKVDTAALGSVASPWPEGA
jgi:site-specific recombinase XerD